MMSASAEPPTLRSMPSLSAAPHRRSYSCYNCNFSFHITPTPSTSAASPSSFRCPRCHHRHLIPHHTISLPPPPPPPPPQPQPPHRIRLRSPPTPPGRSADYASDSHIFVYQSDDESDYDEDYDSDNSLLSFTTPTFHSSTPALKSFVASLPIKFFPPNSTPTLQSCSICMEDFEINRGSSLVINELPCEHYFHRDCIVEWLQRSNTCPLCRYKLPLDSNGGGGDGGGGGGGGGGEVVGEIEGSAPATNQWEVGYDALLVVDLAPIGEPSLGRIDVDRRVDGEGSLASNAAALGSDRLVSNDNGGQLGGFSDRLVSNDNGGQLGGFDFDAMHDEDGDTLMVDA